MKRLYNYFSKLYEKTASKKWLNKLVFIFLGISSTAWFLVRVIPKPSRATYPCMQVASPFMSAFVIYLLSLWGGLKAFKKYKQLVHQKRIGWAALCMVAIVACVFAFSSNNIKAAFAADANATNAAMKTGPNQPVGEGKGIFPGRVTWAHIPGTATWEKGIGYWFAEQYTNQENCDQMMRETLLTLTGKNTEKEAWDALFTHFNQEKKGLNRSFIAGEKIAIKINNNNAADGQTDASVRGLNTSPHMVLSLLRSLINEGGIPQEQIWVGDPSRAVFDFEYNKWSKEFPNVNYVDKTGENGRTQTTYTENVITYTQNGNDRTLASCFVDADYLINFAIPKLHGIPGVTLCAKNWCGVTRGVAHFAFEPPTDGNSEYMAFADHIVIKELGGKTMLFLIDALYGTDNVDGVPAGKWQMSPFNNDWPSSLFASQDPVAIDAVGIDFLNAEWGNRMKDYSDVYLHEAASIPNTPSGVKYQDGTGTVVTKSPGVFEHWNNATDKEYSRNLGKNYGIELVRTVAGPPIDVIGISLNKTTTTIAVNSTEQLTTTFNPANATNKKVIWSSNDDNIAFVNEDGLVTANAVGTATITVTTVDGNKTATCEVTTDNVAVTGVALKAATTIGIGGTEQLTPTFQPADASNKNVSWNSSNDNIASVSATGLITAKGIGNVTITVTTADGNKTADCKVTVNPQPPILPGTNLALNKPVEYVGAVEGNYNASNITDGDRNSRWASAQGEDNKVITIDLQDTYSLSKIVLYWENACASEYNVEISTDKEEWINVDEVTGRGAGAHQNEISVDDVNARYVRINCISRATQYGFSLYEVEVFGDVANFPTSIFNTATGSLLKVYAISGGLAIEGVGKAAVYNIDGRFIANAKGYIILPKGIYIVKAGNETVKAMVK